LALRVKPAWDVLLIGGASGVGKTSLSYRTAAHFGAGLTEIDDLQAALERMTTAEQNPDLHLVRLTRDTFLAMDEATQLAHAIAYTTTMARALEPVIANHLIEGTPLVLEGDFLLPALAAQTAFDGVPANGRVRAVFVTEEETQIAANYRARENKDQPIRARASARHSDWLAAEARRLGLTALPARPWNTGLERLLAAIA
jgi:2-phosphoglycerate kinase